MSEVWVVNASPVIVLACVGELRLVEQLADRVLLPDAVARELLVGAARARHRRRWLGGRVRLA